MRLTLRFLMSAASLAALPGQAVAAGMPQLHFKDPLLQGQVIWGALIFFVFYLILSRSALPRITNVLHQRQERIQNDLNLARKAKEDADRAYQERCAAQEEATARARATIQTIRENAKIDAQAQAAATARRLENEIRQAESKIASMRENALAHLNEIAAYTATSLTERLIGQQDHTAIMKAVEHSVTQGRK